MVQNIIITGAIGSLVFTCFLIIFSSSGWVKFVRDQEGRFNKNWHWKGILGMLIFVGMLLGILVWANFRFAEILPTRPTSTELFLNAFGVFFFIHLYDLIIIDFFLIVFWHPEFLNLPDTYYYKSIKPHIKGFYKGIPLGILASGIAVYLFFLLN